VHAILALGATAEVHQLSTPERRMVLGLTASARSSAALLAGLTGPFSEMVELAAWAAEQGFDGVMVHEPLDPGGSARGLLDLFSAVADASQLPVVPYVRTPRLDERGLGELVAHPNVAAVKYAVPDLDRAAALMTSGGLADRALWVCGLAETWAPAFAHLGMRGFTSGLANVDPALALSMLSAIRCGDWTGVGELARLIAPFEALRNRDQGRFNVAAIKAALAAAGFTEPDVRPPAARLNSAAEAELAAVLAAWSASVPQNPARAGA
jgi:4-hydroxy-tetrahydrodipicolinate synthase